MAIIIPSKNIYEKENNKVRDNLIDKLEIGAKRVVPNNEYEVPIHNTNVKLEYTNEEIDAKIDNEFVKVQDKYDANNKFYNYAYAGVESELRYKAGTIEIPVVQKTKYISKLTKLTNTINGETIEQPIQFSVRGNRVAKAYWAKWKYTKPDKNEVYDFVELSEEQYINNHFTKLDEKGVVLDFPNTPITETISTGNAPYNAYASASSVSHTNSISYELSEDKTKFVINYDIMTYFRCKRGRGSYQSTTDSDFIKDLGLHSDYLYEGETLEITIYGNTIGINLEDNTITIGKGNQHPFSIDGNELLQTSNYIQEQGSETKSNAIETDYGNTLTSYQNGKETATILCSISDYYDEEGTKAISINNDTDKMVFRMYDEVIPMVYGSDGKDRPMSKYNDGTAKKFRVLGVEPIYDGAVWQRLTLQEK